VRRLSVRHHRLRESGRDAGGQAYTRTEVAGRSNSRLVSTASASLVSSINRPSDRPPPNRMIVLLLTAPI
jgi:hypothetical protein